MTTEAQTQANRINAQKSTGPRTPEGRAKVAQNALKHGLLAKQAVVVGEDTDDFDLLRDQLHAEWAPVGPTESRLVERITGLFWRLQRAERFGTESFDVMCQQCADDPQIRRWRPLLVPEAADPVVGLTVVKDFSETRVLERLLVCERRIENSLYRTMAELRQVQGQRQGAAEGARADSRSRRSREGQDRGGPFHRGPETRPPDFTLADLLAKIDAQEDEPAGAATNTPAAEGQSCETKPISEPPTAEAAEPQGLSCETNPIPPRGTGISSDALSGQALPVNEDHRQDADATIPPDGVTGAPNAELCVGDPATNLPEAQRQPCETKPIPGCAGRDRAWGTRDEGESCETKPICVGAGERQVPCSEGVRSNPAPRGLGETKPIAAGAKRERFGYTPIFRRRR